MKAEEVRDELVRFVLMKTTQRPAFLDEAVLALEKQMPMAQGEQAPRDAEYGLVRCARCGMVVGVWDRQKEYCESCGQRQKWED